MADRAAPRLTAHKTWPALIRWILLAVVAGLLLAALGPFGSYLNGGPFRLVGYWVGAMLLGLILYGAAVGIVAARVNPTSRRWWVALIGASLVASIPEALATRFAAFRLWPELAAIHLPLPLWFAQTATLGLIVTVAVGVTLRRAVPSPQVTTASTSPSEKASALDGDILALQMEDHYVRAHRPGGSELILMPLGRAIEAMRVDGLRTHRSWWVASHAVATVEGTPRSMRVQLTNGVVAPVARSAVVHLKAAGWL